jgi:tetratricopeptide (TPR) repeat protein
MADPVTELLQRLAESQGDIHAQSALAAEFALAARPEEERQALRAALDAAAVLRWFDDSLLAQVCKVSREQALRGFESLKGLPFVERYRRREQDLRNIHESTRLGLRKQLALTMPERFRELSSRAAACFAEDLTPPGRIEWIYHLVCGDPDRGARELELMNRTWSRRARVEDRYALAAALKELEDTELVQGRARVWALLLIAWTRAARGEEAQLAEAALTALKHARDAHDPRAEGTSQALLGDAFQAQGKLERAQGAYEQFLTIILQLTAQEPGNEDSQSDLAGAHNRMGIVLQAQGKLVEAQAAFEKSLTIARLLAGHDPDNALWQSDLGGAYNWLGSVLEEQGKLEEAQEAYGNCLAIFAKLAVQDEGNAEWQLALAAANSRVGSVVKALGKLPEAQRFHEEDEAITRRVAEQDPDHPGWQSSLATSHGNVADVLEAQGKLAEAKTKFEECLSINRHLVGQDPGNARWQRDLAVACLRMAALETGEGRNGVALPLYEEASRILAALVEKAPGFAEFVKTRELADEQLARCRDLIAKAEMAGPPSENEPPSATP